MCVHTHVYMHVCTFCVRVCGTSACKCVCASACRHQLVQSSLSPFGLSSGCQCTVGTGQLATLSLAQALAYASTSQARKPSWALLPSNLPVP